MNYIIAAQCLGLFGYTIYVLSSRFKSRHLILFGEALGCMIIASHWFWLSETIVLCASLIALYSICLGLLIIRYPAISLARILGYPLLAVVAFYTYDGSIAFYTAITASSVLMTAKFFQDVIKMRTFNVIAGILWASYALMIVSVPLFLFGVFLAIGHGYQIWRLYSQQSKNVIHSQLLLCSSI